MTTSEASGRRVDPDRLRYFRVLAQTRCAIGTRNGVLVRDRRGEVANHLIYYTLHLRLLVEALAEAAGVQFARPNPCPTRATRRRRGSTTSRSTSCAISSCPTSSTGSPLGGRRAWLASSSTYAKSTGSVPPRTRGARRLERLLGYGCGDLVAASASSATPSTPPRSTEERVLEYCQRQPARETQLLRPAMGHWPIATTHRSSEGPSRAPRREPVPLVPVAWLTCRSAPDVGGAP